MSIDQASYTDLQSVGMVGCWKAAYDPNGLVYNQVDSGSYAASSNGTLAVLAPLPHREAEGMALFVNGTPVTMKLLSSGTAGGAPGGNSLSFDASVAYRIQEISFWSMARQAYQVLSDMFGRLIASNEPFLTLYMPGSFSVTAAGVGMPILPMAKYIENVKVQTRRPSPSTWEPPRSICKAARRSAGAVHWSRPTSHAAGRRIDRLRLATEPHHLLGDSQLYHRHARGGG